MDDVRTCQIGKLEVRRWMEEVRKLAEAEDEELLKTVERINALEEMTAVPPEKRVA